MLWSQDFWETLGAAVAALSGAGAVASLVWKRGVKPWLAVRRERREQLWATLGLVEPMSKRLGDVSVRLESLAIELRPNGGGTLRDAVNEIRRLTREAAQESRVLLDNHPHGIFHAGSDGSLRWVNRTLSHLVGRNRDELYGYNMLNAVDPRDRRRVATEWRSAIRDGREFIAQYRMVDEDGHDIPVRCRATPILDSDGTVSRYLGVVAPGEAAPAHAS